MLSCLAEVELLGDCTKNLQPKIFKLSHGEIIYALGILSHCGAFSSFVLATHFSIASPNVPTSRTKKTRQKWCTHQGLDFDAAVSQTRSDAAGPSEIVPSGVVSVRV